MIASEIQSQPRGYIPITDQAALRAAGIHWPESEHGWRWLFRQRAHNGFAAAFAKIGTRVLVDVEGYYAAVAAQQAGEAK
jgi:hypothetical protein